MRFTADLFEGTLLANVGYEFYGANGALIGSRSTSGVVQIGSLPIFSVSTNPPSGWIVARLNDSTNTENWRDIHRAPTGGIDGSTLVTGDENALTLADLIYEVGELGVRSVRLESDYKRFINRAHRAIAQRRNWTFMHDVVPVTITAGSTSANLPANFKALGPEKSPVTFASAQNQIVIPVEIVSRAKCDELGVFSRNSSLCPVFLPLQLAFIEQTAGGTWTLNLPPRWANTTDAVYNVSCYLFPGDFNLGTDTSPMLQNAELVDALVNRAKAFAYFAEDASDMRGVAATELSDKAIAIAQGQDARSRISGRSFHM